MVVPFCYSFLQVLFGLILEVAFFSTIWIWVGSYSHQCSSPFLLLFTLMLKLSQISSGNLLKLASDFLKSYLEIISNLLKITRTKIV